AFWQKIPDPVRQILTTSLQDFQAPINWPALGPAGKGVSYGNLAGPLNSLIGFNATGNLVLSLEAMDTVTVLGQPAGVTPGAGERFLRMGLLGKLEVGANVSAPVGFIGIKGSASAKGSASLDYYFANKTRWLLVEALIADIPDLVSPFNAAAIATKQTHQVKAIQLNVGGALNASLGISAGKTWGTSFNVKNKSLDLDTEVQISAGASVSFEAGLNLQAAWNVLVVPGPDQTLAVRIQKDYSREKSYTFSLDASIGISGLDAVGTAVINKYMPDATELLTKLNEFSNFGTLLKSKVREKLNNLLDKDGDDSVKQELVKVVVGDSGASDLSGAIGDAVESALNEKLDLLESKAANAGQAILTGAAQKLNLPGNLGTKLVEVAGKKINTMLSDITSKLEGKLAALISENENRLDSLFKPLEEVGTKVSELTADVDKLSQELLGPIIKFLTRYQRLRDKLTAAVQGSSRLKLGLHIGRSLNASTGTGTLLEFEVDTTNPNAGGLYKQMMAGNFKNALAAARKGENGSDGIKLVGGSFRATASQKVTTDVSLNIFGAQFGAKTLMSSDVQAQVDTSGNIMIATSKAEFQRMFKALGESQMVRFINLMEIPGAGQPGGGSDSGDKPVETKIFSSGLSLTYQDNSLKKSELEAYLGSLTKGNLITAESLNAASLRYDQVLEEARAKNEKVGAEIGMSISLTSDDIKTLIAVQDSDIDSKAINNQLNTYFYNKNDDYKIFTRVLSNWNNPDKTHKDVFQQIRAIASAGKLGDALIRYDISRPGETKNMELVVGKTLDLLDAAWHIGRNASNLVKIVRNMEVASKVKFTEENLKTEVNKLNGFNKEMNKYLKDWLKVQGILASLGIEKAAVPSVTLAFIATIGELCQLGYKGTQFLTPVVKWSLREGKQELFL
ncbi:MAG: hypothetical protein GY940_14820, partial [bacterium]|nr:hypothetical protein [bacterium]